MLNVLLNICRNTGTHAHFRVNVRKYRNVILLLLFSTVSFPVLAESFFTEVTTAISEFWTVITVDTPAAIHRFFSWVLTWFVYAWIHIKIETVQFAWLVAKAILEDLSITTIMQSWLNQLEPDLQYVLNVTRILYAFMLVIEALIARFVMRLF